MTTAAARGVQGVKRKNIFVTGQPGSGKTTLIAKVYQRLKEECGGGLGMSGFYTEEVRRGGDRVGFDVVTLDGARGALSRLTTSTSRKGQRAMVGNYEVDVPGFEALALPALQQPQEGGRQLMVIDEVGKMELFSESFKSQVLHCLDQADVVVLGSVPMPRYGREIPFVADIKGRADVCVIHVAKSTREVAYHETLTAIRQALDLPTTPDQPLVN